jgi:hypothetical protein
MVARWYFFKPKNPNKFWKDLQWKMLIYFMAFGSILRPFGKFYAYVEYFSRFGTLYQEIYGSLAGAISSTKRHFSLFCVFFFSRLFYLLSKVCTYKEESFSTIVENCRRLQT